MAVPLTEAVAPVPVACHNSYPVSSGVWSVHARVTEVDVTAGDQPTRQIFDLRAGILSLSSVLAAGGRVYGVIFAAAYLLWAIQRILFNPLDKPENLHIRSWGNVADGTTFTSTFKPGQVLFGKRRAYQLTPSGRQALSQRVSITQGGKPILAAIEGTEADQKRVAEILDKAADEILGQSKKT